MAQFQTFTAKLVRSTSLTEFTKHLDLEVKGPHFGFVPGQWLSVKATDFNGEEITRAYSLASPPSNGHIAFCLNRVQDGFMSNHLCSLSEGDEITFQGPFGNFILHPPMRDTIFIATGTGIAPFRSMLQWLLSDPERHQGKQLWLLFGARTENDLCYREEFERLAARHANFHFLPTLSRGTPGWPGLRGYVQDHVKDIVGERNKDDMHAYICGLAKMVKANRELLNDLGWDRTSIRYERYD
ncbi:MAG TPA: FAD-dependent oxidoreductase [Terriglobales bacterium]|nr:FAD-dependent oxidoreductase [Terriglobales bacterium]